MNRIHGDLRFLAPFLNHKSYSLILSVLLAILTLGVPQKAEASVIIQRPLYIGLTSGLVGYWSFDGADMNATKALDRSGQGNDGTLSPSAAAGPKRTKGKLGQALGFDGVNDYVDVADSASIDVTNVTISTWARHDSSTFKSWEAIVTKGDSAYRLHICGPAASCTQGNFSFGKTIGGSDYELGSTVSPIVGRWYHVVATYDGSTERIYIDGILSNSSANTGIVPAKQIPRFFDFMISRF